MGIKGFERNRFIFFVSVQFRELLQLNIKIKFCGYNFSRIKEIVFRELLIFTNEHFFFAGILFS